MKVGDVYRVFEVTDENYYSKSLAGKQFAELGNEWLGNEYGVHSPLEFRGVKELHFGIDERNGARLIGQLRITKLHNHDN